MQSLLSSCLCVYIYIYMHCTLVHKYDRCESSLKFITKCFSGVIRARDIATNINNIVGISLSSHTLIQFSHKYLLEGSSKDLCLHGLVYI